MRRVEARLRSKKTLGKKRLDIMQQKVVECGIVGKI